MIASVRTAKSTVWDIVFKPEISQNSEDCGIHMLDSADDIIPAALHFLGLNPNSNDPKDLERAAELLAKIRPLVRKFHSSEYLNALASGEICLVVGWSGDIKQAQKRAAAQRMALMSVIQFRRKARRCSSTISRFRKMPHTSPKRTHSSTTCSGRKLRRLNTNLVAYANGNLASQKLIDRSILDDKSVYPDASTMSRLYTVGARDQKTQRLINRLWTKIKTGR